MKTDQATLAYIVEGPEGADADLHELSDEAVALLSGGQDRDFGDQGGTANAADPLTGGSASYGSYAPVYPKFESPYGTPFIDYNSGVPTAQGMTMIVPLPSVWKRSEMVTTQKKKGSGKKYKKLKPMKVDRVEDEFGSGSGM